MIENGLISEPPEIYGSLNKARKRVSEKKYDLLAIPYSIAYNNPHKAGRGEDGWQKGIVPGAAAMWIHSGQGN